MNLPISIIIDDPALKKQLSAAGRQRAREFTVERMVRQHEELYAEVAARNIQPGSCAVP